MNSKQITAANRFIDAVRATQNETDQVDASEVLTDAERNELAWRKEVRQPVNIIISSPERAAGSVAIEYDEAGNFVRNYARTY